MKPFKLRVDWTVHSHTEKYPEEDGLAPVDVELHVMGEEPRTIHSASSIPRAVDWAMQFFKGRGLDFWCNVDLHQRLDHKHITLHPRPVTDDATDELRGRQ